MRRLHRSPLNRLSLRLSVLVACCLLGCLLIVVPFQRSWSGSLSRPALLSPVVTPDSPERNSLNHRPFPLQKVQIPEVVKLCLEPDGEQFDLLGTVQDRDKMVYLLGIYPDFATHNPFDAADELIAVDSKTGCTRLLDSQSVRKPLSVYLSSQSAQALELQRFRRYIILLGGKRQLQQQLNERIAAAKGNYLLSDEQIEALQQLHIPISHVYKRLKPDTFSP